MLRVNHSIYIGEIMGIRNLIVVMLFITGILGAALWYFQPRPQIPHPLPVPSGDQEIAWIQTSTQITAWERFVGGVQLVCRKVQGVSVDDSRAFLEDSAAVPELVIRRENLAGALRIRWYKLSGSMNSQAWVDALSRRSPAPIAFIGGSSSDRAFVLAHALAEKKEWNGPRPAFLITTGTATEYAPIDGQTPEDLIKIYAGRTFRFCFDNAQMAAAILDFISQSPELRPTAKKGELAQGIITSWVDDPYSVDLADQFYLQTHNENNQLLTADRFQFHYSVGRFGIPNEQELNVGQFMLHKIGGKPNYRSVVILAGATQPARRFLRGLTKYVPLIGNQLVAVSGDGIAFNDIYRDGDIKWPIEDIPIPLVFFTHFNPIAWDKDDQPPLNRPSSTDDILLNEEMFQIILESALPQGQNFVSNADQLIESFRNRSPSYFDEHGNRLGGRGEYIVVVKPNIGVDRIYPDATIEVWNRGSKKWWLVNRLTKAD